MENWWPIQSAFPMELLDFGTKTCAGYPGSLNHLKMDADTFAEWKVDMLKLDGCNVNISLMDEGYPNMTRALNATGRPIVYSCSWPAYQTGSGITPDYKRIAKYCNLWRNFNDISLSWKSVESIINYYDHHQDALIPAAGPGNWNDPDMIIVGNEELTLDQSRAQMAIWSIWSAPLLMSNDLEFVSEAAKAILLNPKVIAVDQDPLGHMGRLVANTTNIGVYAKPMSPYDPAAKQFSYAVAVLNRNELQEATVSFQLSKVGLVNPTGYMVEELFEGVRHGLLYPYDVFTCQVNPTGVVLIKATVSQKA